MKKILTLTVMTVIMAVVPRITMAAEMQEAEATAPETEISEEAVTNDAMAQYAMKDAMKNGTLGANSCIEVLKEDVTLARPGDKKNTKAHPYYDWKREFTFAGVPIILSSFIIKSQKKAFRSARMAMNKEWHSEWDNYTQFAPYPVMIGMKALGYEGRSDWGRFIASTLASNVVMAAIVNGMKYSVKEMRPDNSSANSFPSGHTATAFVAASIMHKEYGLTRSPWFSAGAYGVATATGLMRVLNNRHWVSDIMAGAGIGILSTEIGYYLIDLMFKDKGIKHYEIDGLTDSENPSFFDIQMGVGIHGHNLNFNLDIDDDFLRYAEPTIQLGTSTTFGIESAYFFNKYIGIGGMGRITTTPAKGASLSPDDKDDILISNGDLEEHNIPGVYNITLEDNNFVDVSLDAGVYLNIPLSKRFTIGAKFLAGARIYDGIKYTARNGFPLVDSESLIFNEKDGKKYPLYWYEDADGNRFRSSPILDPTVDYEYDFVLDPDKEQTPEFNMIEVKGGTSINWVAGISFSYRYKNNFSWKVFCDYDSAKNKYSYTKEIFHESIRDKYNQQMEESGLGSILLGTNAHAEKFFNIFTVGGAFTVNF